MARRRDGWSFLIADEEDLKALNRLTVDGEAVLVQIAGELVDSTTLSWAYDVVSNYIPMASIVYKNSQHFPESFDGAKSIIETIGLPLSLLAPFNDKNDG